MLLWTVRPMAGGEEAEQKKSPRAQSAVDEQALAAAVLDSGEADPAYFRALAAGG